MESALLERLHPTVTVWNRLEGRPRSMNFDRALRAEVRDALWMLTRQWQTGELRAEDSGSPVFAKVHLASTRLSQLEAGDGAPRPIDSAMPLQAQVERLPLKLATGDDKIALDLRLLLGRRWLKLIAPIGSYADSFIDAYGFVLPDPDRRELGAALRKRVGLAKLRRGRRPGDGWRTALRLSHRRQRPACL